MSDIEQRDLYPIIEIANQRLAEDQDQLTEEQVDAIAEELGIPREYVDEAQTILQQRRAQEAIQASAARKLKNKVLIGMGAALTFVLLLAVTGLNGLKSTYQQVEAKRAQFVNVVERNTKTQSRLAGQAQSSSKAAELAGAENRVHIERKRYDEVASEYNRQATSFPTSFWLNFSRLPTVLPLSHEPGFEGGATQ